jgi:hypothetical protein
MVLFQFSWWRRARCSRRVRKAKHHRPRNKTTTNRFKATPRACSKRAIDLPLRDARQRGHRRLRHVAVGRRPRLGRARAVDRDVARPRRPWRCGVPSSCLVLVKPAPGPRSRGPKPRWCSLRTPPQMQVRGRRPFSFASKLAVQYRQLLSGGPDNSLSGGRRPKRGTPIPAVELRPRPWPLVASQHRQQVVGATQRRPFFSRFGPRAGREFRVSTGHRPALVG